MVSFAVQTLLTLIQQHLFIFALSYTTVGDGAKKSIVVIYVKEHPAYVFI